MAVRVMTMTAWVKACHRAPNKFDLNGPSPGGAAAELGITRQSVHRLIDSGTLDAIRIEDDGKLRAIIIPGNALEAYKQFRQLRQRATA